MAATTSTSPNRLSRVFLRQGSSSSFGSTTSLNLIASKGKRKPTGGSEISIPAPASKEPLISQVPALLMALEPLKRYAIRPERLTPAEGGDLGQGGYGTVKLAHLYGSAGVPMENDGGLRRLVAVKRIRSAEGEVQRIRVAKRFAREVQVWARFDHPNVLPLYGYYLSDDLSEAWLVSRYEPLGNLTQYIAFAQLNATESRRLGWVIDIAEGLDYLHNLNPPVCHGDIKPANVLISLAHGAVLCDFGLSKIMDESEDSSSGLTTSKGLRGSLRYFSPELVNDSPAIQTTQSDVWAWGCLAYEIMTGNLPYVDATTEAALLLRIAQGHRPGRLLGSGIPAHLQRILADCWRITPESRPPISQCLATLLDPPVMTYPKKPKGQKRRGFKKFFRKIFR